MMHHATASARVMPPVNGPKASPRAQFFGQQPEFFPAR